MGKNNKDLSIVKLDIDWSKVTDIDDVIEDWKSFDEKYNSDPEFKKLVDSWPRG